MIISQLRTHTRLLLIISWISLGLTTCQAASLGIDIWSLSHFFGDQGSAAQSYTLKLDKTGNNVFNPGLGLEFDSRLCPIYEGFSFISKGGFFQDNVFESIFYLGAGARYSYVFAEDYTAGGSLVAGLLGSFSSLKTLPLILPSLEFGRRIYKTAAVRINIAGAPNSGGILVFSTGVYFGI